MYGFSRTRPQKGRAACGEAMAETFSHPKFQRNRLDLLQQICRKAPGSRASAASGREQEEADQALRTAHSLAVVSTDLALAQQGQYVSLLREQQLRTEILAAHAQLTHVLDVILRMEAIVRRHNIQDSELAQIPFDYFRSLHQQRLVTAFNGWPMRPSDVPSPAVSSTASSP